MTALALDVRELTLDEIDYVSGGWRIQVLRWFWAAISGGMAYDAAKAAANELEDYLNEMQPAEKDPYTLAKIG